ncbi:hypothetical protein KJ632_05775 [Patescibacteria group bacterium]|nr:hypothetical protein [Patescibacteria group bacterium]
MNNISTLDEDIFPSKRTVIASTEIPVGQGAMCDVEKINQQLLEIASDSEQ